MELNTIYCGDALDTLMQFPDASCNMCITSPPYYKLRDYKVEGQLGQEASIDEYLLKLYDVFDQVRRVLTDDGSLWVDLGDTFNGDKKGNTNNAQKDGVNTDSFKKIQEPGIQNKSLLMIPERFAIGMINSGWCLRHKIVHYKRNAFPQSAPDRFSLDYDMLYHFVKQQKYYFEQQYRPLSKSSMSATDRSIRFGGNKAAGYDTHTYSGKAWKPRLLSSGPEVGSHKYKNALKLGWDGVSDYSTWYFDIRKKQGWHDHSNDKTEGNMQRGQKPPLLEHPYGAKLRSVWLPDNQDVILWDIPSKSFKGAHYATFAVDYVSIPIKATCPVSGVALDPFMGAGTTALASLKLNRNFVGIELSTEDVKMAYERIKPYLQQGKITVYGNDDG